MANYCIGQIVRVTNIDGDIHRREVGSLNVITCIYDGTLPIEVIDFTSTQGFGDQNLYAESEIEPFDGKIGELLYPSAD